MSENKSPDPRTLVLHVHTLPWVSGSGINTFLSMTLLDKKKYRTALACAPGGRLEDLVRERGFDFHPLTHMKAEVSPIDDLKALGELRALYRRIRPDIIHTHNSKAGFLGRLAAHQIRRTSSRPKVVHTVHGFAFHDHESLARRTLFKWLERKAFPWADKTVAISEALATWGAREGIGRKEDYAVVWSGIEIEKFGTADRSAGRARLGLDPETIAIGLVSKLWEGKGHEFLIDAVAPGPYHPAGTDHPAGPDHPALLSTNVKLVFIGEGPLEAQLRDKARRLDEKNPVGAPHIIFAGFLTDTDISEATKALDIAVLPSAFEGMGRVVLEAQAAGVPVVANRVGGIVDVLGDGIGGILVPPSDHKAWRKAVARLINDAPLRARMGQAAAAFVTDRFSATNMVKKLEMIYEAIL